MYEDIPLCNAQNTQKANYRRVVFLPFDDIKRSKTCTFDIGSPFGSGPRRLCPALLLRIRRLLCDSQSRIYIRHGFSSQYCLCRARNMTRNNMADLSRPHAISVLKKVTLWSSNVHLCTHIWYVVSAVAVSLSTNQNYIYFLLHETCKIK